MVQHDSSKLFGQRSKKFGFYLVVIALFVSIVACGCNEASAIQTSGPSGFSATVVSKDQFDSSNLTGWVVSKGYSYTYGSFEFQVVNRSFLFINSAFYITLGGDYRSPTEIPDGSILILEKNDDSDNVYFMFDDGVLYVAYDLEAK